MKLVFRVVFFLTLLSITNLGLAQSLFRAPKIPATRTLGDHAPGSRNGNRFGLSPHLTSAQVVDVGVQQKGDERDFVAPADSTSQPQSETETADGTDSSPLSNLETIEGIEQEAENIGQTHDPATDERQLENSQHPNSPRETIVQRYPDGKPQIQRQVIQDANGNFVNDGFWRVLSRQGEQRVIASGEYRLGVMHGAWQRQHTTESSGLFATKPFSLFQSPFMSVATFNNGKLDGMWTLHDAYERKMFEVPYRQGQRNGTATWWYPSLNKMREVTFKDGLIDGHLREWDEQNKLTRDEEFVAGQKVIRNVTFYRPKQKESENFFLDAKLTVDGEDNWWNAEPAPLISDGERVQHGPAVAWYDNGLPKMKGQYAEGLRVGRFTWWHSNGNKQLEGSYEGDQKVGRWSWWHENGMQAIVGQYENNQPIGVWRWWEASGKLAQEEDLTDASSRIEEPRIDVEKDSIPEATPNSGGASNPEMLPDGETEPTQPTDSQSPENGPSRPALDLNDLEGIDPLDGQGVQFQTDDSVKLPENFFADRP